MLSTNIYSLLFLLSLCVSSTEADNSLYELLYSANVEVMVKDGNEEKVHVEFISSPVRCDGLHLQEMVVTKLRSRHEMHMYEGKDSPLQSHILYFEQSSSGLITNIYHNSTGDEEFTNLQKVLLSSLSGHFIEDQEKYSNKEIEYYGNHVHEYNHTIKDGKRNYRRTKIKLNDNIHRNNKNVQLDEDGFVLYAEVHETFGGQNVPNNSPKGFLGYGFDAVIQLNLQRKRVVKKMKVLEKSKLEKLKQSTLEVSLTINIEVSREEMNKTIERTLACGRMEANDSVKGECIKELANVLKDVQSGWLVEYCLPIIKMPCTGNPVCAVQKELVVYSLARVGSPMAQTIIVTYLQSARNESVIKTVIDNIYGWDYASEVMIRYLDKRCSGPSHEFQGSLAIDRSQTRSCLALGALLSHTDNQTTDNYIEKFHAWLTNTGHRMRRSDGRSVSEQVTDFIATSGKATLIHVLGNIANPASRDLIITYSQPEQHPKLRVTAIKAMRGYNCRETATALLNITLNEPHHIIRRAAFNAYKNHPLAYQLNFVDENILMSKRPELKFPIKKRSTLCNLIEDQTIDTSFQVDKSSHEETTGDQYIGFKARTQKEVSAKLHHGPGETFFEITAQSYGFLNAWLRPDGRNYDYNIMESEWCLHREFRVYNGSMFKTFDMGYIQKRIAEYDSQYEDITKGLADTLNVFYQQLGTKVPKHGQFDIFIGEILLSGQESRSGHNVDTKTLSDKIEQQRDQLQNILNNKYSNTFVFSEVIDKCLFNVKAIDFINDIEKVGNEMVTCIDGSSPTYTHNGGLMSRVNELTAAIQNLSLISDNLKEISRGIATWSRSLPYSSWKHDVVEISKKVTSFVADLDLAATSHLTDLIDETYSSLSTIVGAIDAFSVGIEDSLVKLKQSPTEAVSDLHYMVHSLKGEFGKIMAWKHKIAEYGSSFQGKLNTWMDLGPDFVQTLKEINYLVESLDLQSQIQKNSGNIKDMLIKNVNDNILWQIAKEKMLELKKVLSEMLYLGDLVRFTMENFMDAADNITTNFQMFTLNFEKSTALLQKTLGLRFHQSFPSVMRYKCDDTCGGCGIYPNIYKGRQGVQLYAIHNDWIVSPTNGKVNVYDDDSIIIYPFGQDWENYEILIAHVNLNDSLVAEPDTAYVLGGTVIGEVSKSPCQPNYIHVSVRKINSSTAPADKKETFSNDGSCVSGSDDGIYMNVDQYLKADSPDIVPLYNDHEDEGGCNSFEYRANGKISDMEDMTSRYDAIKEDIKRTSKDVSDDIHDHESVDPMYPDFDDEDAAEKLAEYHLDTILSYYKEQVRINFEKKTQVEYKTEDGIRKKYVNIKKRNSVPTITDYIKPSELTVGEQIKIFQSSGLDDWANDLMHAVEVVQSHLLSPVNGTIDDIDNVKLRYKNQKQGNSLNQPLDKLQGNLKSIKDCPNLKDISVTGENIFCDTTPKCKQLMCQVKFDTHVGSITAPLTIQFNNCDEGFFITWYDKEMFLSGKQGTSEEKELIHQHGHLKVKLTVISAPVESKRVDLTISAEVCYTDLPYCEDRLFIIDSYQYNFKCPGSPPAEILAWCDRDIEMCNKYCTLKVEDEELEYICNIVCVPPSMTICDILNQRMRDFYQMVKTENCEEQTQHCIIKETIVNHLNHYLITHPKIVGGVLIFKIGCLVSHILCLHTKSSIEFEFTSFTVGQTGSRTYVGTYGYSWIHQKVRVLLLATGEVKAYGNIGLIQVLDTGYFPSNIFEIKFLLSIDGEFTEIKGKVCLILYNYVIKDFAKPAIKGEFDLKTGINWTSSDILLYGHTSLKFAPIRIEIIAIHKVYFIPVYLISKRFNSTDGRNLYKLIEKILWTPPWDIQFRGLRRSEDGFSSKLSQTIQSSSSECIIEQIPGRHIEDPAYVIEAAFYDPASNLKKDYCIGTYPEGQDVTTWSYYDGGLQIVPSTLSVTGFPLYVTVRGRRPTNHKEALVKCVLATYDITVPQIRLEESFPYSSHTHKLHASLQVIDDSPLTDNLFVSVGLAHGFLGHQTVEWDKFSLTDTPVNEDGEGTLQGFANGRPGKLPANAVKSSTIKHDKDCAQDCIDFGELCVSFDYEYQKSICALHNVIQSKDLNLVKSGSFYHFERLGTGHSAWFGYENLSLIHGERYYFNTRVQNNKGFESITHTQEIVVDFTPPEPGLIVEALSDKMQHDNCSATVTHGERCVDVTDIQNHRVIVDGKGSSAVFNGNKPGHDMLFTLSNHYATGNWAPFHDNETGIWGYTWAVGTDICSDDVHPYEDPHSHLADDSYWTYQGFANDLSLADGKYYVTVQGLNQIVFGGALVTSVCHSTPFIVDTTPPILHYVEDVFYDLYFDILAVYYNGSDPESGIARTDIGLGETKHDVLVRPYSKHDPIHDGWEMVSIDDVDLPEGIAIWIKVRLVNKVTLLTSGHGPDPIMIDTSPPIPGELFDGEKYMTDLMYQPYDDYICVQWFNWYDTESGLERYVWGVGSSPFMSDVRNFTEYDHYEKYACADIQLEHGKTYYSTLRAYNKAINARMTNKATTGITIDMTDPVAGWVHDGKERDEDMKYSAEAASVYSNWGDFNDPESGIAQYKISVAIDGEHERDFESSGDLQYMEDHSLHFQHGEMIQVTVEATNKATRTNTSQSTGFTIDLTEPEVMYVRAQPKGLHYQTSDKFINAVWQFIDKESKIARYQMRILQMVSANKIPVWPTNEKYRDYIPDPLKDFVVETEVAVMLKNGQSYLVDVIATNGASLGSKHESLMVTVDTTIPVVSQVRIGTDKYSEELNDDGQVIHADETGISVNWNSYDHESGIIAHYVAIGTSEGDTSVTNGHRLFGKIQNVFIDNIELKPSSTNGTLYYVSIKAQNGAGAMSDITLSNPVYVYEQNVPGRVYAGKKFFSESLFQADSKAFAISFEGFKSEMCGITGYEWALGSEAGYSDILPYTGYGIVMLNDSRGMADISMDFDEGKEIYATVKAITGNKCPDYSIISSSSGLILDNTPPITEVIIVGTHENISEINNRNIYQAEYNTIDFQWKSSDHNSDVNDSWCAGSLPSLDDIHAWTYSEVSQIEINEVQLSSGETVYFTVQSIDGAENEALKSSQPLTVDTTPPVINEFTCSDAVSIAQTYIRCSWVSNIDQESPLQRNRIGVGIAQFDDSLFPFQEIPTNVKEWITYLDTLGSVNASELIVTLSSVNRVEKEAGIFAEVVFDRTAPNVGILEITTPSTISEVPSVTPCQMSTTTIQLQWRDFDDRESIINRFEVFIGTEGFPTAIYPLSNLGVTNTAMISNLDLVPGSTVVASVRAVNQANLVSHAAKSSVHISQNPTLNVGDGLSLDIEYQNDLSSISGNLVMDQFCPIVFSEWSITDLNGNDFTNDTTFFGMKFQNDELYLKNFQTYFTHVTVVDAINRTMFGRSNGISTVVQPSIPAEVRDGVIQGVNINFQAAVNELSCNWDVFGSDLPGLCVTEYRVAIGSDPSSQTGVSNVHTFINVGLNQTHSFTGLTLNAKITKYYCTVTAISENGAEISSTSNGVRVGFEEGMAFKEINIAQFVNNTDNLSFYWNNFQSDFPILKYSWGMSLEDMDFVNVTDSCITLMKELNEWSDIIDVRDNGRDTYVYSSDLPLEHGQQYFVSVMGEDASGQCIIAPSRAFLVDTTAPLLGYISTETKSRFVQYATKENLLGVSWYMYRDPESGIKEFAIQLYQINNCGYPSDNNTVKAISDPIHVSNRTDYVFYGIQLSSNVEYKIFVEVTNQAGMKSSNLSQPIYLETTSPSIGDVKIGSSWSNKKVIYQSSTSHIDAVLAVSPYGTLYDCPMNESLLKTFENNSWNVIDDMKIYLPNKTQSWNNVYIEYMDRNVQKHNNESISLTIHNNISNHHLEGGALVHSNLTLHPGTIKFDIGLSEAESTIFSITLSDGLFDEYTNFELPLVSDPLSDEDFMKDAIAGDISSNETVTQTPTTYFPPSWLNQSSSMNRQDEFNSTALGLHLLCFSLGNATKKWKIMVWTRQIEGISSYWIDLPINPTEEKHSYSFQLEQIDGTIWGVKFLLDNSVLAEFEKLYLPENVNILLRQWTYGYIIPETLNPFSPYKNEMTIYNIVVPIEQTRHCQFGKPFYDMESGIHTISVGLSNITGIVENIIPFEPYETLCYPCTKPCDEHKCDNLCQWNMTDGLKLIHISLHNLELTPSISGNPYTYYHVNVEVSNGLGQPSISSSNGVIVDISAPLFSSIAACDPLIVDVPIKTFYQSSNDSLAAIWLVSDDESPITDFEVAVGITKNGTEIQEFVSQGIVESVLLTGLVLSPGVQYFLTVRSTNAAGLSSYASTDGVKIASMKPNVGDVKVFPPNYTVWECEDTECSTWTQDAININIGEIKDPNVIAVEWSIGTSLNDRYVISTQYTPKELASTIEVKDGYVWYNGTNSTISMSMIAQLMGQIPPTFDDEYLEPGHLFLEPGRCIYPNLRAFTRTQESADLDSVPICIRRNDDYVLKSVGVIDEIFHHDEFEVRIHTNGTNGKLTFGFMKATDLKTEYMNSANLTYSPFIVDTDTAFTNSCRKIRNRVLESTDLAFFMSPSPTSLLSSNIYLDIIAPNITLRDHETLELLQWNEGSKKWCTSDCQSELKQSSNDLSFEVCESPKRKKSNPPWSFKPSMFALYKIDKEPKSTPPELVNTVLYLDANSDLNEQLTYKDKESDQVIFTLAKEPQYGTAQMTWDGILHYQPNEYFFGTDKLIVEIREVILPPGVNGQTVRYDLSLIVKEIPFAPNLFFGMNAEEFENSLLYQGHFKIQFEANTTTKVLGEFYICDYNPSDKLNLIYTVDNATVKVSIEQNNQIDVDIPDEAVDCFNNNIKSYHVVMTTSADYHGQMDIVFIAKDNYTFYSQPITFEISVLVSPCIHGQCYNPDDPDCTSDDRANSFDSYSCSCDFFHNGAWCENVNSGSILLIIGMFVTVVSAVLAVTIVRKRKQVAPAIEEVEMEENRINDEQPEDCVDLNETDSDEENHNADSVDTKKELDTNLTEESRKRYERFGQERKTEFGIPSLAFHQGGVATNKVQPSSEVKQPRPKKKGGKVKKAHKKMRTNKVHSHNM